MHRRDFLKRVAGGTCALASGVALPATIGGCGREAPAKVAVATPAGFSWTDHPLVGKVFVSQNSVFSTTFDATTRKFVGGATYYVDVERGSDNNAGTSEDSALQSIAAACDKPDAGTVRVKGYGIDKPYYRGRGFNNRTQSRPINIIGYGPLLPYVTTHDVLTFAPCPGKANVYQTTRPSVTECMDMAGGAPGTRMTKTTSLEACEASPGSWYQSGTALFVHAINSRNLSSNGASRIWALLNVPNFKSVGDHTSYLENLVLYGGIDCVNASGSTPSGGTLVLVNVETGMSEAGGGNNISARGVDAVLASCRTTRSGGDGHNYHAYNGKVPNVIEIDCVVTDCNRSRTDQNSTAHDGARVIRVGGTYRDAGAANVADINGTDGEGTESWNLGCSAFGAGPGYANWQCGSIDNAGAAPKMWLDSCDAGKAEYSTGSFGGGLIYSHNSSLERNQSKVTPY
ncbi:twin-arginine translocation signal domain-containing protein [Mycolicibacterium fluoranthenivorans]|nr:twin-arginine translocation signal domain-containing protein [Mycolicibacterium fluoranthenivorans]